LGNDGATMMDVTAIININLRQTWNAEYYLKLLGSAIVWWMDRNPGNLQHKHEITRMLM